MMKRKKSKFTTSEVKSKKEASRKKLLIVKPTLSIEYLNIQIVNLLKLILEWTSMFWLKAIIES